jgi:transposase
MDDIDAFSRSELLLVLRDVLQVNAEQQERIKRLEDEIARLRDVRGGGPPSDTSSDVPRELPAFVKPNRTGKDKDTQGSDQAKPPRKQRPHGFSRKRETPTRIVEHCPLSCTDCGRKLFGGWLHASRQVIEIPFVPVEIIEHRFMARHCGVCDRREIARPDLSKEAVGKSRLGVRLMSFIGYLDTACRMPLKGIQRLLAGVYRLRLSEGEIVRVLHTIAEAGQDAYADLLSEVHRSAVLHADETGAREDGINGFVWSLGTENVRFYHRDPSRSARVIQELLGYDPTVFEARSANKMRKISRVRQATKTSSPPPNVTSERGRERFRGVLVSDFYAAYSWYANSGGWHQRCLVHLDRDLDDLKEAHARDPAVCRWVEKVLNLIERAKSCAKEHAAEPERFCLALRRKRRETFEQELEQLARPYCRSALPQRVLAERLMKHRGELFVFVHHPDVPSDNNAAERAIRPFVVLRKMNGGTRSRAGSNTQMVLLSLFSTWLLRSQDALQECRQLLITSAKPTTT